MERPAWVHVCAHRSTLSFSPRGVVKGHKGQQALEKMGGGGVEARLTAPKLTATRVEEEDALQVSPFSPYPH